MIGAEYRLTKLNKIMQAPSQWKMGGKDWESIRQQVSLPRNIQYVFIIHSSMLCYVINSII